jgi:hypothetical protein
LHEPGLVTMPVVLWTDADGRERQSFTRNQHQLKGLQAVNANGDPLEPVDASGRSTVDITDENAGEWYGRGRDVDALAEKYGAMVNVGGGAKSAARQLSNAEVLGFGDTAKEQLFKLGHECLKANIRARTLTWGALKEGNKTGETVGGSTGRSVDILPDVTGALFLGDSLGA